MLFLITHVILFLITHSSNILSFLTYQYVYLLPLPYYRYQLKEAVFIQILSFFCFWSIMGVFHYELFEKGLLHPPPLMGNDVYQVTAHTCMCFCFVAFL